MCPLRLLKPAVTFIGNSADRPVEAHAVELANFASWMAGAAFMLLAGSAVGRAHKKLINYALDVATPDEIPVRIP